MSSRQQRVATDLITEVIGDLSAGSSHDLLAVVRKLLRASELLGWQQSAEWFRAEIDGCRYETPPQHRYANARLEYRDQLTEFYLAQPGFPRGSLGGVSDIRPLCEPLSALIRYREVGFAWPTDSVQEQVRESIVGRHTVKERQWVVFSGGTVQGILDRIEQNCFNFAIGAERQLLFGDLASDLFSEYRDIIGEHLTRLGVDESLDAIEMNVRSATPEASKLAMLGCRNVLIGLADKLWQVQNVNVHPTLKTHDGKPLQLDSGQVKARLRAYLHERGAEMVTSRGPTLIAGQVERIADTVDQLYNLTSDQGKNEALVEDAKATVLQTFFLIGEMARLTKMVPVTQLKVADPAT